MRALVANDDRPTAALLGRTLERWGLDVVVAHDGAEAWRILESPPAVDLAVIDWMMPGADGLELCGRVRADPALAHLYLLLLTSREGRADRIRGLDAGADDYLIKPVDTEELRARIHVGVRVLKLTAGLSHRVAELESALSKVKQLSGLLPICSYCKSVRTDHNYWDQVEHYVAQHSDLQFSHGICPDCYDRVTARMKEE
jgi:sigma-B regulation protein RsbU (phosphoserine phosphatase)